MPLDVAHTVHTCVESIGEASDRLGGVITEGRPAGRLLNRKEGDQLIRIDVRIVYDRGRPEERHALVWCQVMPSGEVKILPLDKRPPYALD